MDLPGSGKGVILMENLGTLLFVFLAVITAIGPLYVAMIADFREQKDEEE